MNGGDDTPSPTPVAQVTNVTYREDGGMISQPWPDQGQVKNLTSAVFDLSIIGSDLESRNVRVTRTPSGGEPIDVPVTFAGGTSATVSLTDVAGQEKIKLWVNDAIYGGYCQRTQ